MTWDAWPAPRDVSCFPLQMCKREERERRNAEMACLIGTSRAGGVWVKNLMRWISSWMPTDFKYKSGNTLIWQETWWKREAVAVGEATGCISNLSFNFLTSFAGSYLFLSFGVSSFHRARRDKSLGTRLSISYCHLISNFDWWLQNWHVKSIQIDLDIALIPCRI